MKIKITLYCPDCRSAKVIKNSNKSNHKQNYRCTDCGRQFIGNHALTCKGCHSELSQKILRLLVRGVGIRDIAEIKQVSTAKVLSVSIRSECVLTQKRRHYQ